MLLQLLFEFLIGSATMVVVGTIFVAIAGLGRYLGS